MPGSFNYGMYGIFYETDVEVVIYSLANIVWL